MVDSGELSISPQGCKLVLNTNRYTYEAYDFLKSILLTLKYSYVYDHCVQ